MQARVLDATRVTQLLLDAAHALGETLEPERIYDRFHDLLEDVVPHDGVVVSSYDDRDGVISAEYAWSDGNKLDVSVFPPLELNRSGGGMQSRVILTGEPLLANDVVERVKDPDGTYYDVDAEGNLRKLPESGPPGTQAAMMVPVKHEGKVVGVVQVMSNRVGYTQAELEVVQGLVGQMGAAVRNARLQLERRRLETAEAAARAAAEEREQAANVLDAVGDGIFLVDDERTIAFWNAAAELVTGLSPDEVLGCSVDDVFADWSALAGAIPVAEEGAAARTATLPVSVGGRDLWLSFVAVRSRRGVVYAFRDVTTERLLDEQKSDFIATISHELRTPLAGVYGAAQTLRHRDQELTEDQKARLLAMIEAQAARLSQITAEVLLATTLDRGELPIAQEPVDVAQLARATVEAMRPNLPETHTFEVEVAPGTAKVAGSPERIQQVLMNLLDNAVKYGGEGPVRVRIEQGNGAVRVVVADCGPGIAPAERERIFEKFYRSGSALTRPQGGTGLGLYISRELVTRMGGRLEVSSEPGVGAAFVLELPRA